MMKTAVRMILWLSKTVDLLQVWFPSLASDLLSLSLHNTDLPLIQSDLPTYIKNSDVPPSSRTHQQSSCNDLTQIHKDNSARLSLSESLNCDISCVTLQLRQYILSNLHGLSPGWMWSSTWRYHVTIIKQTLLLYCSVVSAELHATVGTPEYDYGRSRAKSQRVPQWSPLTATKGSDSTPSIPRS